MSITPSVKRISNPRIIIIGGGAAGFFAAVNIAEKSPGCQVTLFEAAPSPLRKVAISGGGRCNVTHACFEPAKLVEYYPRGNRELRSLFARFQPRDTIAWFKERGLRLKTEADGRLFPISDSSEDVIAVLQQSARDAGVRIHTGARVSGIRHLGKDNGFEVSMHSGETVQCDICVMATGYSPPGWAMAASLGHTVLPPVPSLFPFTVKAPLLEELQGISLAKATGRLLGPSGEKISPTEEGAMLITHVGLSGPLIYRLSARAARELAQHRYQAQLILDLLPDIKEDALYERFQHYFKEGEDAARKLSNTRFDPFSHRLWLSLLYEAGLDLEQRSDSIGLKALRRLAGLIKHLPLPVTGKSPSKEEFVSCGGVSRKEVDFKTMQSKKVPGLYFAGEVLDIDGLTGGFNFQACWSAGWIVSEGIADSLHTTKAILSN